MIHLLRATPVLLLAAVGALNPVDAIVRGKWVRHMDCGKGDVTATMCIPAEDPAGVPAYLGELPERVRALHAAGASVVALDLPITTPEAALLEAAAAGQTVFSTGAGAAAARSGHPDMARTWFLPMVLGVASTSGEATPLALEALAAHAGAPAVRDAAGWTVGDHRSTDDRGSLNFMPYEVPFLHWTDRTTWAGAAGKIVFIGACKADRDLTRFGRQPGVVAHSELIETMRHGQDVGQVPLGVDLAVAAGSFLLAAAARARFGAAAAGGVGVVGFLVTMAASLTGAWFGVTAPLLAGVVAALGKARGAPGAPG